MSRLLKSGTPHRQSLEKLSNSLILLTDIISDYNKYCPKISESEKVGENKPILQTVSWKELFYKACVPQAPDTVTWAVCLSCTFTLFYVISF